MSVCLSVILCVRQTSQLSTFTVDISTRALIKSAFFSTDAFQMDTVSDVYSTLNTVTKQMLETTRKEG